MTDRQSEIVERRTTIRDVIPTKDGSDLAVVVVATRLPDGTNRVVRTVKLDGVEVARLRDVSPAWDSHGRTVWAVEAMDGTRIGTRPSTVGAARLAHRHAAKTGPDSGREADPT